MLRVPIHQLVEPIKIFTGDVNPVSCQMLLVFEPNKSGDGLRMSARWPVGCKLPFIRFLGPNQVCTRFRLQFKSKTN
jgi:hypothetical protein